MSRTPSPTAAAQLALPLDYCQRWSQGRPSWRHRSEGGFDPARYDWAVLDHTASRAFITQFHYSKTFPAAKLSVGMYEQDRLVGVAVFGVPVRPEVLTVPFPTLAPYTESIELSRFVIADEVPANAETWFLARAFSYLRAETHIRGVVAFSDPQPRFVGPAMIMPGHWGTIYQAHNAYFLGRSRRRVLTVLPDGTVLNDRSHAKLIAGDRGWRYVADRLVALGATPPRGCTSPPRDWPAAALEEIGARRIPHGGNLRYAFPLARTPRLTLASLPYPKRAQAPEPDAAILNPPEHRLCSAAAPAHGTRIEQEENESDG